MSTALLRRLGAVEAKLLPRVPPQLQQLAQHAPFVMLLDNAGVTVEDFQRNGLAALPRDVLRALVERLKVAVLPA